MISSDIVIPGGSGDWQDLALPFSIPAGHLRLVASWSAAGEHAVQVTGPAAAAHLYVQANPGAAIRVRLTTATDPPRTLAEAVLIAA